VNAGYFSTHFKGGNLRNIEKDFAAIITPGLHLAFLDKQKISLDGITLQGEQANRDIWVCGPAAFVVLKSLAFDQRGENKDAYDLFYMIRNYGSGVDDVCKCLDPLLKEDLTQTALKILHRDFSRLDGIGPSRVAMFLFGEINNEIQADVVGFVKDLLKKCGVS